MNLRIKRLMCLCVVFVFVFCSCGTNGKDGRNTESEFSVNSEFPVNPDILILGNGGIEMEFELNDKEYSEIISLVKERIKKSDGFAVASLDAYDFESGKHLSHELRKNETFVEFVYNECKPQSFAMSQAGGGIEAEEFNVQRIFFSLTRDYHDCFFIGADDDYVNSTTLGVLVDKTELITYVRDLVAQGTALE